MDNLCCEGVISIVGSPRWLAIFKFNQTWYMTSLSMGDYCCSVRKFFRLGFVDGNLFFEPKIACK